MAFAVLTAQKLSGNLMSYFVDEDTQEAALQDAGGEGLRLIKSVSQSVANRLIPAYPSIAFAGDSAQENYTGDVILGEYTGIFEAGVEGSDPDAVVSEARIYLAAFLNMSINCPLSTLIDGTDITAVKLNSPAYNFEPIKVDDSQTRFLQSFQIKLVWDYIAGANE